MAVNRNIGEIKNIFENAKKVPGLINIDTIPNSYDQFTDYNSLRGPIFDDENSNNIFIWGQHKWGSNINRVKS